MLVSNLLVLLAPFIIPINCYPTTSATISVREDPFAPDGWCVTKQAITRKPMSLSGVNEQALRTLLDKTYGNTPPPESKPKWQLENTGRSWTISRMNGLHPLEQKTLDRYKVNGNL